MKGIGSMGIAGIAVPLTGLPAWRWSGLATSWTAEPVVLTITVLSAAAYLYGVRVHHRAVGRWQPTRTVAFLSGLLLWVW